MFKRILVPIDGSAPSRAGLERAIALGKSEGARLRLMHVVDQTTVIQGMDAAVNVGEILNTLQREGRRFLENATSTASRRGVKAESVLYEGRLGRVSDHILREAARWRADVVVMGTHGRRGIGRLVMGSDAESVVRDAPVPVLLVSARAARRRATRRARR